MASKQFPPPPGPTSPPAHQTSFSYPPPPNAASPPQAQAYPPPPSASPGNAQKYPPPPPQQSQSQHYPFPLAGGAGHTPSPQPPQFARPPSQQQQFSPPPQQAPSPAKQPPTYQAPPSQQLPIRDEKAALKARDDEEEEELQASSFNNAGPASAQSPGAPSPGAFVGATGVVDDVGTFNGGSYRISHRDCNTILTVQLAYGCPIQAKPGTMIAMSPTMTLKGAVKFGMKKFIAGGEMSSSTFTGPGELLLGPAMLGDVTPIRLSGKETWSVGQDAFVACTQGVVKDFKRQSLGKAIFSGEGWWVYKIQGVGLLWITSFGAIIRKDLQDGEQYIVDNGHLVAWNTKYIMERIASGGIISGMASGEGLVCKFTGPGTVYIQTRNAKSFAAYITGQSVQTG
ncbi:hypothetical protein MKZ38_001509 [Zalerion maritima]|uniref:Altered inheritance of mitochondria protein 24, mitochondrial n=1 Tax=Zalerion maritima TaxID=339359 RepID=A0AAD5WT23_9PEZI|nr:hypothetical protein MKZ38_001509 [Zalerion maritima]